MLHLLFVLLLEIINNQMREVDFSDNQNHRVIPGAAEHSEGPKEVPKQVRWGLRYAKDNPIASWWYLTWINKKIKNLCTQITKTGWFSGWFKSKPNDVQENTKNIPDQMVRFLQMVEITAFISLVEL